MSDHTMPEPVEPLAVAPPAGLPPTPPPARKRDWVPVLYALGFIVLAGAVVWLWQNPPAAPADEPSQDVELLQQQVHSIQERLVKLEQRPAPTAPVNVPVTTGTPAAPPAPTVDLAPLIARIAALEARQPPPPVDLGPLEAAVAKLEQRPVGDPALPGRVDALSARTDALSTRVDTTTTAAAATAATTTAMLHRQDAVDARLAPLEKDTGQITALADRSARIARIQAAQAALDSGTKLGDIPGAALPLARYATASPPTEASLRLAFPAAADAALAASRPVVDDKPFLDRAWARAQDLVTLRQGDHVILGDPAAGVLARARAAVDAGDLAAAVGALGALTGPAAAEMAGWKAQAQGLLEARRALADMAAHA